MNLNKEDQVSNADKADQADEVSAGGHAVDKDHGLRRRWRRDQVTKTNQANRRTKSGRRPRSWFVWRMYLTPTRIPVSVFLFDCGCTWLAASQRAFPRADYRPLTV